MRPFVWFLLATLSGGVCLAFAPSCVTKRADVGPESTLGGTGGSASASASSSVGVGGAPLPTCTGNFCGSDQNNCGAQGHSCLGGECKGGVCQAVMLATTGQVRQLALDADYIYAGMSVPFRAGGDPPCSGLPVVLRISRTTGETTTLVSCGDSPGIDARTASMVLVNGWVVWSALEAPVQGGIAGEMFRTSVQGGPIKSLGYGDSAIVTAAANGTIYYGAPTPSSASGIPMNVLASVDADGSNQRNINGDTAWLIATDDANIYYVSDPCFGGGEETGCDSMASVKKVSKAGGGATTLAAGVINPQQLFVRGGYVYWLERDRAGNAIRRVAIDGEMADTVLPPAPNFPFTVDGTNIYWAAAGPFGSIPLYNILSMPVDGGPVVNLHSGDDGVQAMVDDDKAVVWSGLHVWLLAK